MKERVLSRGKRLFEPGKITFQLSPRFRLGPPGPACNKQLIYAYYGSKEGLADAVYDALVADFADAVPFDAADLPAYAGRLFDHYQRVPDIQRLVGWYHLERGSSTAASEASTERKIAQIAAVQADGIIGRRFTAPALLALILRIAAIGSPGSVEAGYPGASLDELRDLVVRAVKELC